MGWESTKVVELEVFEITYFRKKYVFLSNFYPVSSGQQLSGNWWKCQNDATKHTMIKRIQSKLQSNQSVRVDLERERRKMANVSPRAVRRSQYRSDRPMSSMSIRSSRTSQRSSWERSKSFQSGKVLDLKFIKSPT